MSDIRVRFAPSPTGFIHIGNLRTALYDYLVAKQSKGVFMVRIEDTDRARFVPGALERVLETLQWAGMRIDEGVMLDTDGKVVEKGEYGPYTQSKRLDIYRKYVDVLLEKGVAYHCFCSKERLETLRATQQAEKRSPKYDKHCLGLSAEEVAKRKAAGEVYVIRMNIPEDRIITFTDEVYGKISVPGHSLDDSVILKSDGFPTYHLAVVVDDHLMKISHVIRGEDWIPSAPKHVLLYEYFGWDMPKFVHLPNILGDNKKKLSKRQGDVSVDDFIEKGYLPDALVNFIAYLGWHPKEDKDVMSMDEIVSEFDISRLQKAGAVFNREKLDWLNGHYIKRMSAKELVAHAQGFVPKEWVLTEAMMLSVRERLKTFSELPDLLRFYFVMPAYEVSLLRWKDMDMTAVRKNLEEMRDMTLGAMQAMTEKKEKVEASALQDVVIARIDESGRNRGESLWPLRVALSGQKQSPSPFEILVALGIEAARERIDAAIRKIDENDEQ